MTDGTSLEKCIIQDCKSGENGGGIYMEGGKIKDSTIDRCAAESSGGGISISSGHELRIASSTISGCSSNYGGGLNIESSKNILLNDVEIIECTAKKYGSGMSLKYETNVKSTIPSKIIRCKQNNSIYAHASDCEITLDNLVLIDCIEDLNSKSERLMHVYDSEEGWIGIDNCIAYNTLPNGDIEEYNIEDYMGL